MVLILNEQNNFTMAKSTKNTKPSGSTSETKPNSSEMKTTEIRDLIDFISKSGLNEVNIETKELKLQVKRDPDQKVFKSTPVAAPMAAHVVPAPVAQAAPAKSLAVESAPGKKMLEIKSPMIGTFYRTANPDSPPFVSVGDKVTKGQPVCIIEAMKLFNEIESEIEGKVVRILVENAQPVEYDQPLFEIEVN